VSEVHRETFESMGWRIHSWPYAGRTVTVLHREPFRLSWIATQLVTFVYVIDRVPEDYRSVLDDYAALRKFAGSHKRTFLPFAVQCGYALLPIYVGASFPESLVADVRQTYRKRWCVFHVPSLLETGTGRLHTLEAKSFWGCVYRPFVGRTIAEVARVLAPPAGGDREAGIPA